MSVIEMGDRGRYHTNNRLNDLTSKEWLKFTKSWFIHNPPPRRLNEELHPAKFPESMIKDFILFFTKSNATVLDPFLGTGSTLIACHEAGRNGIGIELQKKYATIAHHRVLEAQGQQSLRPGKLTTHQRVFEGNASTLDDLWLKHNLPDVNFVITSPPYGNMLQKSGLAQDKRREKDLDTQYSESENDFGNITETEDFVKAIGKVFLTVKQFMIPGSYLVIIIQNYMHGSEYIPLAWDVAREVGKNFTFRGVKIWCQDNKTLYPYGYRYSFVPNVHHHYCLIFRT